MTIGERIKHERLRLNIKQKDLSEYLGVAKSTLGMWETNKREPGSDILIKLSKKFNVTIDYLLGISDERIFVDPSFKVTAHEQAHIQKYRKLDASGRDMVDTVLDKEVERLEARENQKGGEEYITLPIAARGPLSDDAVLTAEEKVAADAKHPELAPKKRNDY